MKRKKIIGSLLFACISCLSLQAQEDKIYNYFHPEYEDNFKKNKAQKKDKADNDNLEYFHDISLDRGVFMTKSVSGTITTLHGSHFFNDKLGIRSGLSYVSEIPGSGSYWKAPVLFSFRTETFSSSIDKNEEFDSFREYLIVFLVNILPKNLEFNLGASLGYMTPDNSATYSYLEGGSEILRETNEIHKRFASSLDGNVRISYPIWRFGLNFSMGASYLWTKNYIYKEYFPIRTEYQPALFGNFCIGISFRF
jgi:hypothetical protein